MKYNILNNDFLNQQKYIERLKGLNEAFCEKNGQKRNACVKTYGCQQNVADSEKIKGILNLIGYNLTNDIENSDLIIYNTCAVRENAEDRVFGNTGKLKQLKKIKKEMIIGLCGCMTQQPHIVEKIKQSYPYVDLIMGAHSIQSLPMLLYKTITRNNNLKIIDIDDNNKLFPENIPILRDDKINAYVPIMYGCDNFCSYCIVPYVRGHEKSRHPNNIINEVQGLILDGYKEITLLGQNVNSYGKGLDENINFSGLLRQLNKLSGDFLIKFMTSHPKDCSKELIDTIASSKKIAHELHLPLQSGSDKILKLMNRKYNISDYKKLINYARSKIDNLVLSSDIIVGFPGELYEDFLETKKIVEEIKFDFLFTFIYSKREGTLAAKMVDAIPEEEKHLWLTELLETQAKQKKS